MKKKLVALTGAGISAESGIPTFRGSDGLWMGHRVEDVATPGGFKRNQQKVLDFYNLRRRNVADAKPNGAHHQLVKLEDSFNVVVITQNIDDLHERAGSSHVIHLHGEIFKKCSSIDKGYVTPVFEDIQVGEVAPDGSQWRPFVVWFEEGVPQMNHAVTEVRDADFFVVIGTSLQVYPAAGLINYVKPRTPKFIIDNNIPNIGINTDMICIELSATQGMMELTKHLLNN